MKTATLLILVKDEKVLLGFKKKGEIGTNTLNGPGGKVENGESLMDCVIRETQEEVNLTLDPNDLKKTAIVTFYNNGTPDFEVHLFYTTTCLGVPAETTDMSPAWYNVDNIPFDKMLASDHKWFARAVNGETFTARVYYKERAKDFDRIEFDD